MESGMISVDRWTAGSQAFFLTHLHAERFPGLYGAWRRIPLICSRITAKLLPCKFPDFNLSLLRIVDIGSWHSISLISPSTELRTDVVFMAIDAQHCPGAVMYLFRGESGYTLYTGDFRWETSTKGTENARDMLLDALKGHILDTLYLDNIYCNPQYSFPSREVAGQQAVDLITSHPDHEIVIAIDSLGKEDLLLYISQALHIKIWVWPERLQIMHLLGFHQTFTTQTALTRVRAIPRYSFSLDTLKWLNRRHPTIGIFLSGAPWCVEAGIYGTRFGSSSSQVQKNTGSARRHNEYIYSVPYSDRSCYSEIQEFIELLRPVNIEGMMSRTLCCTDPRYYFDHLCGAEQALWRAQQGLENEEGLNRDQAADIKHIAGVFPVAGRKRKRDLNNFLGIRISRVGFLRRRSRGAKLADTESLSD